MWKSGHKRTARLDRSLVAHRGPPELPRARPGRAGGGMQKRRPVLGRDAGRKFHESKPWRRVGARASSRTRARVDFGIRISSQPQGSSFGLTKRPGRGWTEGHAAGSSEGSIPARQFYRGSGLPGISAAAGGGPGRHVAGLEPAALRGGRFRGGWPHLWLRRRLPSPGRRPAGTTGPDLLSAGGPALL